jgi:ABC-2 type transport system permease protein
MIIVSFAVTENTYVPSNDKILLSKSTIEQENLLKMTSEYANNPTNENLYRVRLSTLYAEIEDIENKITIYSNSWQTNVISSIKDEHSAIASLQMIKDGIDPKSFNYGANYSDYTKEEASNELDSLLSKRSKVMELLKNGHYYDYVSNEIDELKSQIKELKNNQDSSFDYTDQQIFINNELIKIKQYVVDHKISDEFDLRVVAQKELEELITSNNFKVLSEDEFKSDFLTRQEYRTYDNYKFYINSKSKYVNEEYNRLWYAMENSIELTNKSKTFVEGFSQLPFLISFIAILSFASIISREYRSGSIRLLLTQGVRRYKILLSKYIVMFLSTYALYILFLIIFILFAIRKCSFSELFIPQLVTFNGNPMLVNYYLYLFLQVLLYGLPSIFILTFTFMISTIKKGAVLATSLSVVLALLSLIPITNYIFISALKWYFLKYVPISYMNLSTLNNQYGYDVIDHYILNPYLGAIVLLISTFVMYIITHFIFVKRDVRN